MFAVLFAAALAVTPPQGDNTARDVLVNVCLPFVGGDKDRAAAEFLGFVVANEHGVTVDMATSEEPPRFVLRLADDEGEDDGEVQRACTLQARTVSLDTVRGAIRRPLEQAGFVAEATQPANRPVWTRQGVTVSLRQSEGRATVLRVTYSSLEAEGG